MDLKLKFVLVAVGGVLAGMLLLGTALAIPAAFHFFAGGQGVASDPGFGPGMMGRGGMMDERGFQDGGPCPNYQDGGRGPGMMGPRGQRDGRGFNGDGSNYQDGTCPHTQDATGTSL